MEETKRIMEEYQITDEDLQLSKGILANRLNRENKNKFLQNIETEATIKSKVEHWRNLSNDRDISARLEFMNRLGRKQCGTILKARSQMLPCKKNMKGSHDDMRCRLCLGTDTQETQKHILQECPTTISKNLNIEYENIFKNMDIKQAKNATEKINNIVEMLNNM